MAGRRMRLHYCVAIAAMIGGAPLGAQSTNNIAATAPPPPAASAAPPSAATAPPSGTAVGPPQLRDFSLDGTVTRPAETSTPPPATGRAPTATPSPATPAATERRAAPAERRPEPEPVRREPPAPPARTVDSFSPVTPPISTDLPLPPSPVPEPALAPPVQDELGIGLWPWLAAGLALVLGGGFLLWRRQQERPPHYVAERGTGTPVARRDVSPAPSPAPRPAPQPAAPAIAPRAARPAVPTAAPPPAPPSTVPGGIVASGLKPRLEFELVPQRVEVDEGQGAAVTVEILVINRGSAPARDVLVEAGLINAGPGVDGEVGKFFQRPPGNGQRLALIKPMSSVSVRLRLAVDAAGLAPLVIDGRKLLVPLVAVNAFYRWSGGEMSGSASFLVGRGESEAAKLAPFRLDLGPRSWSTLTARQHSNGLQR